MQIQRKKDMVLGLVLAGFALLIIHLILSGAMQLYINSKLIWLSKLAAGLLIVMAATKMLPIRHKHNHSCNHGHTCSSNPHHHSHSSNYWQIGIFLLPLICGFVLQPSIIGASALTNSINTSGPVPFYATSIFANQSAEFKAPSTYLSSITAKINNSQVSGSQPEYNPENKSAQSTQSAAQETDLVDLAFKIYDHPDQAYNQAWRLTCFVYKDSNLNKNQFVMTRVVMACCVADATPIGIIAETPDSSKFKADTWLEVEGVLQNRFIKDADKIHPVSNLQATSGNVPYFMVTKWKRVEIPKDPYLVPPM